MSIYVERAYQGGHKPEPEEITAVCQGITEELLEWGFISKTEVVDPTWIDIAYTWAWPGSTWRQSALESLQQRDIYQVGRYGRWGFQGIADSIRDGFVVGTALRNL